MRSPPEDEEFRRAVLDVAPLRPTRRSIRGNAKRPAPGEALSGSASTADTVESGEELCYVRGGMSRQVLRRLRRGHWMIEDHLDLHGMNQAEAAESVAEFLRQGIRRRVRCVRIVHGKGLGSRNREPVLKPRIYHWLSGRDEVLAFCQAPPAQGGSGAVLVLLNGRR